MLLLCLREDYLRRETHMGTVNGAMIGSGVGAEFIPIYAAHPSVNICAFVQDAATVDRIHTWSTSS